MELAKLDPDVKKKYLTTGIGDTIIALVILIAFTFMGPVIISYTSYNNLSDYLSYFAGTTAPWAIMIYVMLRVGFKKILKFNQLLAFSIVYVVTYFVKFFLTMLSYVM